MKLQIYTGSYLPKKILTNDDLSKILDTNNEWIMSRTGIAQRHIVSESETTSDLATFATQNLFDKNNLDVSSIEGIIVATTTADLTFPSTASIVQYKLGATKAFAFDIQSVCAGFVYALSVGYGMMKSMNLNNILVIGAESLSKILNWKDRSTAILFGDGAGAVLLKRDESRKTCNLFDYNLHTDGSKRDILKTSGGVCNRDSGHIEMLGQEVFKHAIYAMQSSSEELLLKNNLISQDIEYFIPHQANIRIIESLQKKMNLHDNQVIKTVAQHANTSAASIPLALDTVASGLKPHKKLLLTAIGGGLSWGSVLLET